MSRLRALTVAAASLILANTAQAQVLLNDTFNGLNGGNSSLNYASFPNWSVSGTVDLVKSGDFGINCVGGIGSCVDLDGSRSAAGTLTSGVFFLGAGDTFTLTFDLSGSQRNGPVDDVFARFDFGGNTTIDNIAATGLFSTGVTTVTGPSFLLARTGIASNMAWTSSSVSFRFVNGGQVSVALGTNSADNIGPVLDNVMMSKSVASVVPEPSTYALMAAGLAAMGVVARRRRRA